MIAHNFASQTTQLLLPELWLTAIFHNIFFNSQSTVGKQLFLHHFTMLEYNTSILSASHGTKVV